MRLPWCWAALGVICFAWEVKCFHNVDDLDAYLGNPNFEEFRLTPTLRENLKRNGPPMWASSNQKKNPEDELSDQRERNFVSTEMEVRWAAVAYPEDVCPEERVRDDDDADWRITYLAKACWHQGATEYVCNSGTAMKPYSSDAPGSYTCFMDATDDDENTFIALDDFPLLIPDFLRWIYRILGWPLFVTANKAELSASKVLTGKKFESSLLKGSSTSSGGTLDITMIAFNKQAGKFGGFSWNPCTREDSDQVPYGDIPAGDSTAQGLLSINYQSFQQGKWHYFDHAVTSDKDPKWPLCYYSFKMRWRYFERAIPIVDSAWPNGFHAPPYDYAQRSAKASLYNAQRSESIYLFGPNIIGQGQNVGDVYCTIYAKSDSSIEGAIANGDTSKLSMDLSNFERLTEFMGRKISNLGAELDRLERGTDALQRDYLSYYGGPSQFVSGEYESAVECPGFLLYLEAFERTKPGGGDPIYYKEGTVLYVSVEWVINGARTLAKDNQPVLLHGDFSRTLTTATVDNPTSYIFQPNSLIVSSRWDMPINDNTNPPDLDEAGLDPDLRSQGTDLFFVEWRDGPGLNPEFGIVYQQLINNWDGTYTLPFTVDFAGTYCVFVYFVDPITMDIVPVGRESDSAQELAEKTGKAQVGQVSKQVVCGGISFTVEGLSLGALPDDGSSQSSTIAWATSVTSDNLKFFNTDLVKSITNNYGVADVGDVLGPLFKRLGNGWFQQRQTVSIFSEWPGITAGEVQGSLDTLFGGINNTTKRYTGENGTTLLSGTIHTVRRQGIGIDDFCDAHIDPWGPQKLTLDVFPWEQVAEFDPQTTTFLTLTASDVRNDICVASLDVYVDVLRNPEQENDGIIPSYSISLRNVNLDEEVLLSSQNLNPMFNGAFTPLAPPECCEQIWCNEDIKPVDYNTGWKIRYDCPGQLIDIVCVNKTSGPWEDYCDELEETGKDVIAECTNSTPCEIDRCDFGKWDQCGQKGCGEATTGNGCDEIYGEGADENPCGKLDEHFCIAEWKPVGSFVNIDFCEPDSDGQGYKWNFTTPTFPSSKRKVDTCQKFFEDQDLSKHNSGDPLYFSANQLLLEPAGWRALNIAQCNYDITCNGTITNCQTNSEGPGNTTCDFSSRRREAEVHLSPRSSTCYDYPPTTPSSLAQPSRLCFNEDKTQRGTKNGLKRFVNKPVAGDWQLIIRTEDGDIGAVIGWQLAFVMENCNTQAPPTTCAFGEGTESFQEGTDVSIECPEGTVIGEVKAVSFGWPEMSSECGDITLSSCNLKQDKVRKVVERECLNNQGCELSSEPEWWVTSGTDTVDDWLCPEIRCNDTTFERCPNPNLPYLKVWVQCNVIDGVQTIEEIPKLNVIENNPSTYPTALLVHSATHLFDAFTQGDRYVVEQRDDVLTVFAREGGCFNAVIKTAKSTGGSGFEERLYTYEWCYTEKFGTSENITVTDQISMAAGDFDGDRFGEVAIGWVDAQSLLLNLVLWDMHTAEMEDKWDDKTNPFISKNLMTETFTKASHFILDPKVPQYSIAARDAGNNNTDVKSDSFNQYSTSKGFVFAIASGDLNFDLADEAVLVWIDVTDLTVHLQVFEKGYYKESGTYKEAMIGQVFPEDTDFYQLAEYNNPHAVAVAVGDFEGTGNQEIAVAVSDDDGLWVELIEVDELRSFALRSVTRFNLRRVEDHHSLIYNYHNVKMATGGLNDDGRDELVVAYSTSEYVRFYVFSNAQATTPDGSSCSTMLCMAATTGGQFRVGPTYEHDLVVSGFARPRRPAEFHLAVGNIDNSRAHELVIAAEYNHANLNVNNLENEPATKVMLTAYASNDAISAMIEQGTMCNPGPGYVVQPNVENPLERSDDSLNEYTQNKYIVSNFGMAVGNLFGMGLRVAPPDYFKTEGIPRILAILSSPPAHIDSDIDGGTLIVNGGTLAGTDGSFCTMGITQGVTAMYEFSKEAGTATTDISGGFVDAQVSIIQGSFDTQTQEIINSANLNSDSTSDNLAITKDLTASQDDVIMYTRKTVDVWKYNIVDQDNIVIGTIDIQFPSSCGNDCIEVINGREARWYNSDHQVFNLFSYSTRAPKLFTPNGRLFVGDKVLMGVDGHEQYITTEDTVAQGKTAQASENTQDQTHWKLGAGIKLDLATNIEPLGLGASLTIPISVSGGYESTNNEADIVYDLNTNEQANMIKSSQINVVLEGIDPGQAYWVQPFLFEVKPSYQDMPFVVLDFVAEPYYEPGRYNFWQDVYNKPDLTFNLAYSDFSVHRSIKQQTKEFEVTPMPPVLDEPVTVKFWIRNYSTREAAGVRVYFWKGNPDNCADFYCRETSKIGVREIRVAKQGSTEVEMKFIYDGIQNIFATVDDLDDIVEIHEKNNKAYNFIWEDFKPNPRGGPYGEYTFEVASLELGVDEKSPTGGFSPIYDSATGRIEAYEVTVKVTGNSFNMANVMVLFFLGDPQDAKTGGDAVMIEAETISRLDKNSDFYTTIRWDVRDIEGDQTLHVFLVHDGFEVASDNILDELVMNKRVGCYYRYDECGVCGGDSSSCRGCDGVINSNNIYDRCGVCAGDGTTCCTLRSTGGDGTTVIRIKDNSVTPQEVEIFVGDKVVWENHDLETSHYIVTMVSDVEKLKILEDPNYGNERDLSALDALAAEIPAAAASGSAFNAPDAATRRLRRQQAFPQYEGVAPRQYEGVAPRLPLPSRSPSASADHEGEGAPSHSAIDPMARVRRWQANVPPSLVPYYSEGLVLPPSYSAHDGDASTGSRMPPRGEKDLSQAALEERSGDPDARRSIFQRRSQLLHLQRRRAEAGATEERERITYVAPNGFASSKPPKPPRRNIFNLRTTTYQQVNNKFELSQQQSRQLSQIADSAVGNAGLKDYLTDRDKQANSQRAFDKIINANKEWQATKEKSAQEAFDNRKAVKTAKSVGVAQITGLSGLTGGVTGIGGSAISGSSFTGGGSAGRLVGGFDLASLVTQPEVAAPEPALGPGKGSLPVPFAEAGAYAWFDQDTDVIQGTIIVKYVPYVKDECGVCNGDGSFCTDCQGVVKGTAFLDGCDICSNGTTGHAADSDKDCNGVCFGSAVLDDCGTCVLGSTGREFNYSRDCAGICNGPHLDECGVCWDPTDNSTTPPYDCMYVCGGTAHKDYFGCDVCVEGTSGKGLRFPVDCNDDCFGFAEYDHCGECTGGRTLRLPTPPDLPCPGATPCDTNTATGVALYLDCAGVCDGDAYIDPRDGYCRINGTLVLNTTKRSVPRLDAWYYPEAAARELPSQLYARNLASPTDVDCNGDVQGSAMLDACGICYGGETGVDPNSTMDCAGTCDGNATIDVCGVCSGGTTGKLPGADLDCYSVCFGSASVDDCDECTGGSTGLEPNGAMDCAGMCFGDHTAEDLSCNCPTALDDCYECGGDSSLCAGCDGVPWSGVKYDYCGVCGGDGSTCCFFEGELTTISFDGTTVQPSIASAVTGATIRLENRMFNDDPPPNDIHGIELFHLDAVWPPFQTFAGEVAKGEALEFTIAQPGRYMWASSKYPIIQGQILVAFNANTTDACGVCGGDGSTCCQGLTSCGTDGGCVLPGSTEAERRAADPTIVRIHDREVSPPAVDISTGSYVRWENFDDVEYFLEFEGPASVYILRLRPYSSASWQFHAAGSYRYTDPDRDVVEGFVHVLCDEASPAIADWEIGAIVSGVLLFLALALLVGCTGVVLLGYIIFRWLRAPRLVENIEMQPLRGDVPMDMSEEEMQMAVTQDIVFDEEL